MRLCLFCLAVALRWAFALSLPAEAALANVDARGYHQLALNLMQGHGFSLRAEWPYVPDSVRVPTYPLFIAGLYALFGPEPRCAILVQGLLDGATTLLLFAAVRCLADERAGLIAALVYAFCPVQIRFCSELLTEVPLAFLLTALLWLFTQALQSGPGKCHVFGAVHMNLCSLPRTKISPRRHGEHREASFFLRVLCVSVVIFGAGLLSGLAMLTKPNVQLLPLILIGALALHWRRKWRACAQAAALVLAGTALAVSPWALRNRLAFDHWMLSSAYQVNLARVSGVATLASARGDDVAPWTPRWEEIYLDIAQRAAERYGWDARGPYELPAGEELERQREVATVAREIILRHPGHFLRSHLSGVLRSLLPQEHRLWYELLTGRDWQALPAAKGAVMQALRLVLHWRPPEAVKLVWRERVVKMPPLALMLGLAGTLVACGSTLLALRGAYRLRTQPAVLLTLASMWAYLAFLPGPIAYIRFRVPVMPIAIALVALGVGRRNGHL